MAGAEQAVYLWKEWGIQALVLLSFMLQVTLLVLAEFRKSMDSGVLRAFIWSAYQLADSIAIYVLGHFSITSTSPQDQLMAFWAPFLLIHLGGQDNITAYAIEDNRLWLRHLLTLVVQGVACAYVLYKSSLLATQSLLHWAAILMFVVGIIKYGERIWALKRASSAWATSNYVLGVSIIEEYSVDPSILIKSLRGRDALLLTAHQCLDVPMIFLERPVRFLSDAYKLLSGEELFEMVAMQLSLMHDIFYTKVEVMLTWYGICIRVSVASTFLVLLVLGLGGHKDSYKRVDIIVSYVLLVGALLLETTSLLRAMFSSWVYMFLVKRSINGRGDIISKRWASLCRVVASVRQLVHAAGWRRKYSSGTIGQHNLLQLCVRSKASKSSNMARRMGFEDPWNTMVYSSSIPVSTCVKQLVMKQVLKSKHISDRKDPNHILNSGGWAALTSNPLYEGLTWSVRQEVDFEKSILIWHLGTDIYLSWYKQQQEQAEASGQQDMVEAVSALSNYMLFLLAARPHMLPSASRRDYVYACYGITGLSYSSVEDLAGFLKHRGDVLRGTQEIYQFEAPPIVAIDRNISFRYNEALKQGCKLGAELIGMESPTADTLEVMGQVWAEMLCYAGRHCNKDSHAKQLSYGGELVTIAALLVQHMLMSTI